MSKDQSIGAVVLVACVAGILVYGCLVFDILPGWSLLVLKTNWLHCHTRHTRNRSLDWLDNGYNATA